MPDALQKLGRLAAIDLKTPTGRRAWINLMLECLDQQLPREVPDRPYELRGVEPWDIRKLLESDKDERHLSAENAADLRAWRKWREEVIDTEARNTNTLHGLLMLTKYLEGAERYKVEYFLSQNWNVDSEELRELLDTKSLYFAARRRCLKLNRCPYNWREPRWKGYEHAGS